MKKIALAIGIMFLTMVGFAADNSAKIIGYLPGWNTPPAATELSAAGYTHVVLAFGVFSTITPGQIMPRFSEITPEYIQSLQSEGIKVLLALGGPATNMANTTTNFHSVLTKVSDHPCFAVEMENSLETLITQYGFDGFDIHIEHGLVAAGSFSNPKGDIGVLAHVMKTLHRRHPDILFSITANMSDYSVTSSFRESKGTYPALVMQTAPILSWVSIQLYNSPCVMTIDNECYGFDPKHPGNNMDTYVAMATNVLEDWPSGLYKGTQLAAEQLVLGFPSVDIRGASDGDPAANIVDIKRSISCLRTDGVGNQSCKHYRAPRAYVSLGGVSNWDLTHDQNNQYYFAKSLKKCVLAGNCR